MSRFAGKTALVTGGLRGIGACIVKRFTDEGARVMVTDLDDEPAEKLSGSSDRLVTIGWT